MRLAIRQRRDRKERLLLIGEFFDALEKDYLAAFPDEEPVFKNGLKCELRKWFDLRDELA